MPFTSPVGDSKVYNKYEPNANYRSFAGATTAFRVLARRYKTSQLSDDPQDKFVVIDNNKNVISLRKIALFCSGYRSDLVSILGVSVFQFSYFSSYYRDLNPRHPVLGNYELLYPEVFGNRLLQPGALSHQGTGLDDNWIGNYITFIFDDDLEVADEVATENLQNLI